MELPRRDRGDELLKSGEMAHLRLRLRNLAPRHDLATVIVCAFDHRTRTLPFLWADMSMAPAGVRAIGSAMLDAGFPKTRIVLEQWNRNFRPSLMRLDGRIPDLLMVSSMTIHTASCQALIRDACRIDPQHRPLIIAGGPKLIYEPWSVFSNDPQDTAAADVVVTGEEYVLLSLLEVLLTVRAEGESMRSAFLRARRSGALDGIPGLVYSRTDARGLAEELVDTGVQRLLGDLDELPHPALGYRLLEPPSRRETLAPEAIPADQVRKHSRAGSLLLTLGCRFRCSYCPIPAYNQRQSRGKSGPRLAEEIERIYREYDIRLFFGADDNFLGNRKRALEIGESLARKVDAGSRPHCKIRWATEATVHDVLKMQEHLPLLRKAGLCALWLGVEDLTATLVQKGQDGGRTLEAFRVLRQSGIFPVPMLMHYDAQPLFTWRGNEGLLNQVGMLRKAGALYTQVLMLVPGWGSKTFVETYTSGMAYQSVDGVPVEPKIQGGSHVIASWHPRPWIKQLNILAAYAWFFNPLRFFLALLVPKSRIPMADVPTWPPPGAQAAPGRRPFKRRLERKLSAHLFDAFMQLFGMWGLIPTARRTLGWTYHLFRGRIVRHTAAPTGRIPMRSVEGGPASHALPGTPQSVAPASAALVQSKAKAG
jgi:radical SAM superfamily enzyme YgiQ (UPF0313 family)